MRTISLPAGGRRRLTLTKPATTLHSMAAGHTIYGIIFNKETFVCVTKYWYFCKNYTIMGKNTSISLGDHFEEFILNKIGEGRYHSASEIIRAGLRLLEQEERKIEALKNALELGEHSGVSNDFKVMNHLNFLHKSHLKV